MNEQKKENDKLEKVAAVTLITILLISVIFFVLSLIHPPQQFLGPGYTSFFTNISADAAYDLINKTVNLTIIDCRGLEGCGSCTFKNEGHIKGAELNCNSQTLYNWTQDILVYSKDGVVGASFCQELIYQVKGNLYNLNGGINSWNNLKYPLVFGS